MYKKIGFDGATGSLLIREDKLAKPTNRHTDRRHFVTYMHIKLKEGGPLRTHHFSMLRLQRVEKKAAHSTNEASKKRLKSEKRAATAAALLNSQPVHSSSVLYDPII